jgi:hypothetical protein
VYGPCGEVSFYPDFYLTFNTTNYTLFCSEGTSELGVLIFIDDDGRKTESPAAYPEENSEAGEIVLWPGSVFEVFFADAVFEHQFIELAGSDAGIDGRFFDTALIAGEEFL